MRVVIDLQGAQTGSRFRGIGRYSLSIAKAMARVASAHEIVIALSGLFPETHDAIRAEFKGLLPADNIKVWSSVEPVREIDESNAWRYAVAERIREAFLQSLQPDVIFVTSLFEGLGDNAVCSVGILGDQVPTVVLLHDLIPLLNPDEHFRASGRYRRWYRRRLQSLKRAAMLLAVSESSRLEALSTGWFTESDVVTVFGACGSEFQDLRLSKQDRVNLLTRLGISRPFVMYTGGGDERKNLHRLIEAYADLPLTLRRKHQLVIAGKMPKESVNAVIQTGKLKGLMDDELVFTGYIDDADLVRLYNTCDLFVLPSTHEGFGLPILEAMACGAPVIGSNVTSLPEVIGLREAMFDPMSIADMRTKIERALTDQTFRDLLRAHGAKQFRKFSWERSAEIALSEMQSLSARRKKRGEVSGWSHPSSHRRTDHGVARILVVMVGRPSEFIHAIPAMSKLRARYPRASMSAVVSSANVPIAKTLNLFDTIHQCDFIRTDASHSIYQESLSALLGELGRFDLAIDMCMVAETRVILMGVYADTKVGYMTLEGATDGDLDVAVTTERSASFSDSLDDRSLISNRALRLVDAIPCSPDDFVALPTRGFDNDTFRESRVVMFPDGDGWRREQFEQLTGLLEAEPIVAGIDIYWSKLQDAANFRVQTTNRIRMLPMRQFTDITRSLSCARVCVSNDPGFAELASYLELGSVMTFAAFGSASGNELSDNPSEGRPTDRVRCQKAYARANDELTVEDVHTRVLNIIASHRTIDCVPGSFRYDGDALVRRLLHSISMVKGASDEDVAGAARAISANHPTYSLPDTSSLPLGVPTDHASSRIEWRGFSKDEPEFRWTDGHAAAMVFECPQGIPRVATLVLRIDTMGEQRIIGYLNKNNVLQIATIGVAVCLSIRVENLREGVNILEFRLPDARTPGNGDGRMLGIAVRDLTIAA